MNISRIYSEKPVSAEVNQAAHELAASIEAAIKSAKDANMPQGLLVGMLHAYTTDQTNILLAMRAGDA